MRIVDRRWCDRSKPNRPHELASVRVDDFGAIEVLVHQRQQYSDGVETGPVSYRVEDIDDMAALVVIASCPCCRTFALDIAPALTASGPIRVQRLAPGRFPGVSSDRRRRTREAGGTL